MTPAEEVANRVEDLIADLENALPTAQECVRPAIEAQIAQQKRELEWMRRRRGGKS